MRKLLYISLLLLSCNKEVYEASDHYQPLAPARKDANAGVWKTVLSINPNNYAPATPMDQQSPAFHRQLDSIVELQKNATKEDRLNMYYWGAGGVLRWNEILRELVAKYNLPPVSNPDGTYPIPSAANPLAYPYFPFANPPYAARAYAYMSVAVYDALVTAYYWKSQYDRTYAYQLDGRILPLLPDQGVRAYPSADAVIYSVSGAMLKLLFPGEIDYINNRMAAHKRARLLSGLETPGDLSAGEMLGNGVVQLHIQRARTDNAGKAVGIVNGVNLWKEFENAAIARNETPWISQETPKRPPMLPYFGRVKPFLFDSLTMVTRIRPAAPPSTSSEAFKNELEEVKYYSQHSTRERMRIVHFWADGVGTYTPPGHWNALAADAFQKLNWSEVRWARGFALLNMSLMDAAISCWDAKYTYYNPRPSQVDPSIKTLTGLPNFPSYISGHSTFSGAAAEILGHLIPNERERFVAMAKEASLSRLFGAIHYRSDCEIGLAVGKSVGGYAVLRALTDGAGN